MDINPYVRFAMHHVFIEGYYLNREIWDHEFIFIEQGSLKFVIEGKTYIAKQNDLVALRPNVHHIIEWNNENCYQPHVHFDFNKKEDSSKVKVSKIRKSLMTEEELTYFREDFYKANGIDMPYIIHLKNPIRVKEILYNIIEEFTYKTSFSNIMLEGLMKELIGVILRENENANTSDKTLHQLNQIINYMNANVDKNLTLSSISSKMNISNGKLIQLFKDNYHTTPMKFYNHLRYTRAREQLENTAIPIQKIAYKMHFDEPQTFSRWFKNIDGNYPSFYRRKTKK